VCYLRWVGIYFDIVMYFSVFSIPVVKVSNFKSSVENIFFKQRLFYVIRFLLLYSTPH
jgi:hypothetical protein